MSFRSDVEHVVLDSTALMRLHRFDLEAALSMAGRALRNHTAEYQAQVVAEARLTMPAPARQITLSVLSVGAG